MNLWICGLTERTEEGQSAYLHVLLISLSVPPLPVYIMISALFCVLCPTDALVRMDGGISLIKDNKSDHHGYSAYVSWIY